MYRKKSWQLEIKLNELSSICPAKLIPAIHHSVFSVSSSSALLAIAMLCQDVQSMPKMLKGDSKWDESNKTATDGNIQFNWVKKLGRKKKKRMKVLGAADNSAGLQYST